MYNKKHTFKQSAIKYKNRLNKQKKIVLIGKNGQLASSILSVNSNRKFNLHAFSKEELDVTDYLKVEKFFFKIRPSIVINSSAYTLVDKAEEEIDRAFLINSEVPFFLSKICSEIKASLIHISTDYVFDGKKNLPYLEDDKISPIGIYGKSKAFGEINIRDNLKNHIIIRTSWLYSEFGSNFVKSMLRLGKEREVLNIVSDQFGSPTYAIDLACAIFDIAEKIQNNTAKWGTYHFSNGGNISWYTFAKKIFEIVKNDNIKINSISSKEYKTACERPKFSVLDNSKIFKNFGIKQKDWVLSLTDCATKI